MEKLTRAARITIEVSEGAEVLTIGHETARRLWNYIYWCVIGHNRQLGWQRGDIQVYGSLAGRLPKYPGRFTMEKELRDDWRFANLSDRTASTVVKDFDIAMRSWFSNLKSNPRARPPRTCKQPRLLTFEVGRNAKHLGDWHFRLTVLGGNIKERHAIVRLRVRPGLKVAQVKLIRVNPDLSGTVVYYDQAQEAAGVGNAAVDLGIVNAAVLAFESGESILYSGKAILDVDRHGAKQSAHCKPSGWKGKGDKKENKSKRDKRYRKKAANIHKLAFHNMTRSIIDECVTRGVGRLVVGDLKCIRGERNGPARDHGKAGNQKLHAWPFAEVRRQLEYKGKEVGIEVIAMSERYTSKTCHVCGSIDTVRNPRGLLRCRDCGLLINSDVNGAFNILKKVSPGARAFGVEAILPGLPSPTAATSGIGKVGRQPIVATSQIGPTHVAKFDLRNWAVSIQQVWGMEMVESC